MNEIFIREEMLLGSAAIEKLSRSHIAVFGLGGVGSWCAEALARSGVGELTLIDQDRVSISNLNRQACALASTVDTPKVDAMASRLLDINPDLKLHLMHSRYEIATRDHFFSPKPDWDFIVDAIDLVACKVDLIETALQLSIPIVSALGTGNKLDASLFSICDISKTEGCPLARVIRRELRRKGINHHTVVFSPEEGIEPMQVEEPPPGRRSVPGSLVWVTATAGMLLAQHTVLSLIKDI